MSKTLKELIGNIEYRMIKGELNLEISGLTYDSRQVRGGELFACLPGLKTDGHRYLREALQRGAAAVMIQSGQESALPAETPAAFSVKSPRASLAAISANFYDYPSDRLHLVGVTGTNGKSTTVHLLNTIFRAAGFSSGVIGTLAYQLNDEIRPAAHTTPEAPDLQSLLAEMRDRGITHVSMEVSSHALHQYRADGCHFPIAVFTNLSRDHFDYHANEEDYLAAKNRLFSDATFLPTSGKRINIINADDPAGQRIAASALGETITYGIDSPAQVSASEISLSPTLTEFTFTSPWGKARLRLPLLGRFNIYNSLTAAAAAMAGGIPLETAVAALEQAQAPTGRFQRLPSELATVIIDYAHTPDGLEKVLATARAFCRGRLFVVFGCGGDRDPGKRPLMGEIAARLADICVITSDNPRSEDPEAIIRQILSGVPESNKEKCLVESDREKAIQLAIRQAEKDDLVVLAGKGHETYQLFADRKIHFDDREVAEAALQNKSSASAKK